MSLLLEAIHVFFPQNYLRKQVEPIFLYFENLTKGWTEIPENLMDQ